MHAIDGWSFGVATAINLTPLLTGESASCSTTRPTQTRVLDRADITLRFTCASLGL